MIFRRKQREFDAELQHHLDLLEAEHRARGLSPEEARHAAQRDIGGILRTRELYREQQGFVWLDHLWRDFKHAFRSLRRTPALTASVIATLALGIGANTAIFSVVQDVVMEQEGTSYSVHAVFSSKALTKVLGVSPFAGRDMQPDEEFDADDPARPSVALISYRLFQDQYAGERQVLGRTVRILNMPRTIIGVLPPDFRLPLWDVVTPQAEPDVILAGGARGGTIGRLRPGVTAQAAAAELASINTGEFSRVVKPTVRSLHDYIVGGSRRELLVLSIAVACVLLIACVNVTNLLLARSLTRTQETSVRTALGASRIALLRGVLAETSLLSLCGGVCGVFLAGAILSYVASLRGTLPRLPDVRMDVETLAFAIACCFITAILAAMGPVLSVLSPSLMPVLRRGGESHASQSRGMRWFHNGLAAAQIGLALLLVSAAGLLLKSINQSRADAGVDARHVLVGRIEGDSAQLPQTLVYERNQELLRQIRLLPGVRSAAIYRDFGIQHSLNIDGSPRPQREPIVGALVSQGFFAASGHRLLAGRLFNDEDYRRPTEKTTIGRPIIVNRAFIRKFAPTLRSLDQAVNLDIDDILPDGKRYRFGRIVGVVGDVDLRNMDVQPQEFQAQSSDPNLTPPMDGLVIRTAGDPADLKRGVRNILRLQNIRLLNPETLEDRVNSSVATRQFETNLLTAFATVALTLAIVGIYGVLSYAVSQRTREIGIRVAMGASRGDVLGSILRDGWKLTLAGMAVGLVGSLAFTQTMRSMLTNVEPTDPLVLALVCALIFAIATLAALVPARRATRVDPMIALRYE